MGIQIFTHDRGLSKKMGHGPVPAGHFTFPKIQDVLGIVERLATLVIIEPELMNYLGSECFLIPED